jgi:predicted glycoside hydrolase/deacetylase ChbG (UPF0249 family)
MKKRKTTLLFTRTFAVLFAFIFIQCNPTNPLLEKLGYSSKDKLLIIHTDDLGLSKSHNRATIVSMTEGVVNSAAIMMPCSWAMDAAVLLQDYPDLDVGVHLTFTNEWYNYRWGTVSPMAEVPSLINEEGFMYPDCKSFSENATPEEVELEIRAQIEAALTAGINISHLDAHMSCIFRGRIEYLASYLKLAAEYGVVPMVSRDIYKNKIKKNPQYFRGIDIENIPYVDRVLIASEEDYEKKGMDQLYTDIINNLKPGITVLLIHTAFDDEEMKLITEGHDYWHSPWRNDDFEFFTSEKANKLIQENNIKLITWKDINPGFK